MIVVRNSDSPTFTPPGGKMTGMASPTRGSQELSLWRVRLEAGLTPEHFLDAEEIFAVLSGSATLCSDEKKVPVRAGDTIIVAPGDVISFRVEAGEHLEAICAMRTGGKATMRNGGTESFLPPWTV